MGEQELSKITVYKVKVDSLDELSFARYKVVKVSTYRIGDKEFDYRLFFWDSWPKEASWYSVFEGLQLELNPKEVPVTQGSGFILMVSVSDSFYAVTGGFGYAHLQQATKIEERFGIVLAEKILSQYELKGLAQKDTVGIVNSIDRVFRGAYNPHSDISNLRRVLTHVRGTLGKDSTAYSSIGKSISASDALTVHGRKSFEDIIAFLVQVDDLWRSGVRRISIPQLQEIKKKHNRELLEELWLALTDVICCYSRGQSVNLFLDNANIGYLPDRVERYELIFDRQRTGCETYEDVFEKAAELLGYLGDLQEKAEAFRKMSLDVFFDDGTHEKRELCYFVCGDLDYRNDVYFINNRHWYQASEEFISQVNEEINNIELMNPDELGLVAWDLEKHSGKRGEYKYNNEHSGYAVLDNRFINVPNEKGGIEFCDLLGYEDGEARIIHVKHACGAELRALFAQGFVSAQLFSESLDFRSCVNEGNFTGNDVSNETKSLLREVVGKRKREVRVIYAIFDDKPSHKVRPGASTTLEMFSGTLTTFAKIDLLSRITSIRSMGFQVGVTRIKPYPV